MTKTIYVIYDTETKTFWSWKAKCAWTRSNYAINAWQLHTNSEAGTFHKQKRYVLKELTPGDINEKH